MGKAFYRKRASKLPQTDPSQLRFTRSHQQHTKKNTSLLHSDHTPPFHRIFSVAFHRTGCPTPHPLPSLFHSNHPSPQPPAGPSPPLPSSQPPELFDPSWKFPPNSNGRASCNRKNACPTLSCQNHSLTIQTLNSILYLDWIIHLLTSHKGSTSMKRTRPHMLQSQDPTFKGSTI